jgi:ABC-type sugar transport system substrate-binding protein
MASSAPTMIRFSQILFLLMLFVLLSGCKRSATDPQASIRTVVFLSADATRPYELTQVQNFQRMVGFRDRVNFIHHDAKGDSALQAEQFGLAMAEKPFAIAVSPVDAARVSDQVVAAVQLGVVVVGIGEAALSLPCTTVVTTDLREVGRLAGDVALKALKRKALAEGRVDVVGRVVEIRGDDKNATSQAMHEGFMGALKAIPGVILVHDAPGAWTKDGGKARALDALRLQTSFEVVYAHNDAMALGAVIGLGEARANLMVIGTGGYVGVDGGLSLVNKGDLDATVFLPILVDLAWNIITQKMDDPSFIPQASYQVAPTAITPSNADQMLREGPPPLPML